MSPSTCKRPTIIRGRTVTARGVGGGVYGFLHDTSPFGGLVGAAE